MKTRRLTEEEREQVRRMIRDGVSERTAYRRIAKVHQMQEEPAFDYDKETPKGEWV